MVQTPKQGKPKVSVVLPVYNAELYLKDSITSILNQTFRDFELLLIDDASQDGSFQIMEYFAKQDSRIVLVKNDTNLGLTQTLNKMIKMAKAKYIARMDNDDISLPDRLEKQYTFMEEHPEVGVSGGTMEIIDAHGKALGKREYWESDENIRKNIFKYSPFSHPLIIMRKTVLNKAGLYDKVFCPSDDYEIYFRIGMYSQLRNIPDVLLKYRISQTSITADMFKQMFAQTLKVRKKYACKQYYTMGIFDKFYMWAQYLVLKVFPFPNFMIRIFNYLRNS
ncbi:glycosyltransferase [bacterium]|nr:glycosyltransferase [bacterium]